VSEDARRHRLRETFEELPELYDRARPGYPNELFDDLIELARLRPGARLLEIGCGTGKATVPLAERGFRLVCVELGEGLARVARARLGAYPAVDVVNERFETWEPTGVFDGVVSFTAFHWIDPDVRYQKSADVLRERGALAVADSRHVLPDSRDRFWIEVQEDYNAVIPGDNGPPPPHPNAVTDLSDDIDWSGRFRNVDSRHYVWQVRYTADEYIAVLDTYSGHRAMPDDQRDRLYARIRNRIEREPEQAVTKSYLTTLNVAERL
jgi:SAM-dependent methyltransferase